MMELVHGLVSYRDKSPSPRELYSFSAVFIVPSDRPKDNGFAIKRPRLKIKYWFATFALFKIYFDT